MIDLIEKHRKEFIFTLRLLHKPTGLFVCHRGLTERMNASLFFSASATGARIDDILEAFHLSQDHPWLARVPETDWEIESEVG